MVPSGPCAARDVVSVLDEPATADVSIHWVVEGWPQDVRRAIDSFRANAGDRDIHYVVADVTGEPARRWGDDVEVVQLEPGTGWGAARNAGLKRSRGRVVLAMDGSIEATGDVLGPLEAALADPTVGVCGPFGIVTPDLREFDSTDGPEADAIEGYCMAFRREILTTAGLFDEKFRWYRTADIEYSFRVKDLGPARRGRARSRRASRAPDVVPDAAGGPGEVVQAELLPVPRSMARPVRPDRLRGTAVSPRASRSRRTTSITTVPSP